MCIHVCIYTYPEVDRLWGIHGTYQGSFKDRIPQMCMPAPPKRTASISKGLMVSIRWYVGSLEG